MEAEFTTETLEFIDGGIQETSKEQSHGEAEVLPSRSPSSKDLWQIASPWKSQFLHL